MNREIFIVKNNTISDIELKSFGLVIPSGTTTELGDFDIAVLSNEIFEYIQSGDLVRIINNVPVDSGASYYQSIEPYSTASIITNIISVARSGASFTSIQQAIDSITDATYLNRYIIEINTGEYLENVTMKNFVSIRGQGNETKILGTLTFNSSEVGNSEVKDLIVDSTNAPSLYINTIDTSYRVYTTGTVFRSYWDNDSTIQSTIDLESGSLYMTGRVSPMLFNTNTGSTGGIDTIFYIHGTNKVELASSESISYIYEYSNDNNCSLIYNTNTNTNFNDSLLKDGMHTFYLYGSNPSNMVKTTFHSGSTAITTINNYYTDIRSVNDVSNIVHMPVYNNWSVEHDVSGSTLGSEIFMSFCTFTWDQVKIPDNAVYIGAAVGLVDWIELLNCIFDTNFDIIPNYYTVDGESLGFTLNISNSWGVYYNNNSVISNGLQIGENGAFILNILNDSGLTSDSDSILPTQQAVKRYVDDAVTHISGVTDSLTGSTNGLTSINKIVKLGGDLIENTEIGGSNGISLTLNPGDLYLYSKSGITIANGGDIMVVDSLMKYHSDYSNIFTDYTLVHKKYVDDLSLRFDTYTGTTGLQQVTSIGATTSIESSFNGGIVTGKIRLTGDTTTAFQIINSGGTSIINVDTISGFTGFKTNSPSSLIHAFGNDDLDDGNYWGLQSNSIQIDGIATGDKDIVWSDSGVPKWAAEIYRNENGKFWYLYNNEGQLDNLTIAETGQIGINIPSNIMKYHTITISGSNEGVEISGLYDKTFISVYQVRISNVVNNPNEYQWRISKDLGYNFESWSTATGCTLDPVLIDSGIYFNFVQTTGYTLYDSWQFNAFPQTPQGTLIVNPNFISEVMWSSDYQGSPIIYNDITGTINNPQIGGTITVFNTGTTDNAIYFGTLTKSDSLYFNINNGGVGVTMVTEYWNGLTWVDVSIGNSFYLDTTVNLTKSGNVSWNVVDDWIKSYPQDHEEEEGYFLYWLRLRTVSSPSVAPTLNGVVCGGNIRFGAMTAPYDARPSFYVDALGRTSIGGGNISGKNILQINKSYNSIPSTLPTLVEIDSEDSSAVDLKIKLSTNDTIGSGVILVKTRGVLDTNLPIEYGDEIGHITWRGFITTSGFTSSIISSKYYGDSTTRYADLIFSTASGDHATEKVRISKYGTGFGVTDPTSLIHLDSGTTSVAPLKFTDGDLLTVPEYGAVEYFEGKLYLTNLSGRTAFITSSNLTLQEVTSIGATTTIESTFNGGIVTSKIRPSGDTTTSFQITRADGITPVINIDTNSGLTGFGTINQKGLVHVYGTNTGGGIDSSFTQTNALIVDGVEGADKDINWSENGVPMWLADTYRGEKSKFWYLYNVSADNVSIAVTETGRIGFNKQPNTMKSYSSFIGVSGLDDMYVNGVYNQNYNSVYEITIFSTGSTDTFKWRKSIDGGFNYGSLSSALNCTTGTTNIDSGVQIYFNSVNGHTIGSKWQFGGYTQAPDASFTVAPIDFKKVLTTNDYTAPTIVYNDITGLVNGGTNNNFELFHTGSTEQSLYFGNYIQVDSIFVSLTTFAESVILIAEYWNGSSWIALTNLSNNYTDGTNNLTNSGKIVWTPLTMSGWTISSIPDYDGEFYWMRFRTSSNPSVAPIANSFSIGTDKRFAVYSSYNNYLPNFYVDSIGRINIGGGNITGKNVLQINSNNNVPVSTVAPSLVEFDSEDSSATDLKIRLASNDNMGTGINMGKTRGTLSSSLSVQNGDELAHIAYRTLVNGLGYTAANVVAVYTGNGSTTRDTDLILLSSNNIDLIEGIRLSGNHIGFGGVTNPNAIIHIQSGNTTVAPMKFTSGTLLTSPEVGAVEFLDDSWYGTITTGSVRKTFAFLESPQFTGVPNLPSGTTLAANSLLIDIIFQSGGTDNPLLLKVSTFNTYTGNTSTDINNRLLISDFNIFTGTTLPTNYYTKTTVDTLLNGKSNTGHTHTASSLPSDLVYTGKTNTYGDFNQLFRSGRLILRNPANSFGYVFTGAAIAADRIVTMPLLTAGDTIAVLAFAQTFTNKTMVAASNTITDTGAATGDLLKHNGTRFVRFARGTANQILKTNWLSSDLIWGTLSYSELTNTGHTHVTSNITDLSTYSGFTNYYIKTEINTLLTGYTSLTVYNTFTGTTLPNNYVGLSTYNTFTGTTLPNNYVSLSTYNTYTGSTVPWTQVSKSGSSIADLETRNSSDVTYNNTYWNVTDVKTALDSITDNIENTVGTGRISPITVLGGLNGKTLWVSGGTGFINYQDYHRTIVWNTISYDLTSYSANTYYVYVSNDSNINISTTEPDKNQNIYLGQFYYDSFFILTISQSSNVSDRSILRLTDYTIRMGGFIYDDGGVVYATGTTQHIVSTACKVQYGLLDYNLSEINTYNNPTFTSSGVYLSSDIGINVDYYFLLGYTGNGKVINNRYNIPTNPSDYKLTGHTLTFTQYSNTVTSTSNLTGLITDDHYIYLVNSAYMTPVSSVTWDGGTTTITLEDIYLGPSGSGVTSIDKCLPKLPSGKWVKHLVLRTTSDNMAIIYGQQYFDTQDLALSGGIPSIPFTLTNIAIKMATITVNSGITDYSQTNVITDTRPLPFTYAATAGGGGGGGAATSHGALTGLLNDDHPQYLLTNGSRNITGIISYDTNKTFTSDTNLVSKKYVDDSLLLKLNITDFNTYTGSTASDIDSRLLSSTFVTFTGTTLPANYLTINNFNTYTGTTLPNDYYTKTQVDTKLTGYTLLSIFNTYTGNTSTDINNRLLISSFNTFTGTTLPANYVSLSTYNNYTGNTTTDINNRLLISDFNIFTGTTLPNDYYTKTQVDTVLTGYTTVSIFNTFTGTTLPANYLTINNFNTYTGTTLPNDYYTKTQVDTKLTGYTDVSTFNTFTGTTLPANYLTISNFNTFTGTTLPTNYYTKTQVDTVLTGYTSLSIFNTFTGTTLPTNYVSLSTYNTYTGATATTLSQKANLTSPNFSGTSTSTTAAADTNTTQIATTAFVVGQAANTNPLMDGSVAIGTSLRYARQDHIHASDTSKVNLTTYNSYTGTTDTAISNRLLISSFNTFTGTTLPANYLTISDFNTYTGTTVPNTYYTKTQTDNLLNVKANLTSPNFSGTSTSTTAAIDTNSTQIATTAFVVGQASATNPLMNGIVAIGTSLRYARQDHVHPSDTSKVDLTVYNTFTGVTLPDNYYTKALTDAQYIKGTAVDATDILDGRSLVYDSASGNIIYKSILDTPPTVQAIRTTNLVVPATWTNVTFDVTNIENKAASLYHDNTNTDRIYVIDSGYYELKFQTRSSVVTAKTNLTCQFLINNTTVISGGTAFINTYLDEVHPLISIAQVYLTGGTYVGVQVIASVASQATLSGDTVFTVTKMDGIVGAQGATGSGSNIIVKKNSVNLTNTPHSSLNFAGGISAVDAGGGVATISSPLYGTEFHCAYENVATTMTGTTYATKLTLTTSVLAGGLYKITAAYGINKANIYTDLLNRVMVDDSMIGYVHNYEISDITSYLYTTRIFYRILSAASHTILLQFTNETSGTITMQDCSLELIRVS